jgi:hypothetical protein
MLAGSDVERAAKSFGGNAERLIKAKRHYYDPDNVFRSAIRLPADRSSGHARAAGNARKRVRQRTHRAERAQYKQCALVPALGRQRPTASGLCHLSHSQFVTSWHGQR